MKELTVLFNKGHNIQFKDSQIKHQMLNVLKILIKKIADFFGPAFQTLERLFDVQIFLFDSKT